MKKILSVFLILVLLLVLIAGGYVAYMFIDYHRIEDNLALDAQNNTDAALPAGETLTAVTWNVGFGAYSADYSFFMDGGKYSRALSKEDVYTNISGAAETMLAQNADILLVQEVDTDSDRAYHVDERAQITDAFPKMSNVFAQNYDSGYLFYPITCPHGASKSGLLTLSNAQITDSLRRSLPIETGIRKFLDLDRCYSITHIPVGNGKALALFNIHLSAYTSDGVISTEQIAMLTEDMQAEYAAGNYVIAGGDFNKDVLGDSSAYTGVAIERSSWTQPFPTELIPTGFSLVTAENGQDGVMSCRFADAPYQKGTSGEIMVDAFLISDNVRCVDCEVIDTGFAYSDHNPVRMEFILEEGV